MKKLLFLGVLSFLSIRYHAQCSTVSSPTNDCSGGEYINSIYINNIFTWGNGGCGLSDAYTFFGDTPRNLMIGGAYAYTIMVGGGITPSALALWIDLNDDQFYTANEMIFNSSSKVMHIGTFTIPVTASPFTYGRMRVRSSYLITPGPNDMCTNYLGGAGETEDYWINLYCGSLSVPAVTVTPPNPVICKSGSVTLTANGAANYTWTPTGASTKSIVVSPTVTTQYTVTATNTNCPGSSKKTIKVTFSDPTVTATPSRSLICSGESNTITASGAGNYAWVPLRFGATYIYTAGVSPGVSVFSVTGTDAVGCKSSASVAVIVDACTGIADVQENHVLMYPNPASHFLQLTVRNDAVLLNVQGQAIYDIEGKENEQVLDVSQLPNGIYYLRLKDSPALTQKIIVQH